MDQNEELKKILDETSKSDVTIDPDRLLPDNTPNRKSDVKTYILRNVKYGRDPEYIIDHAVAIYGISKKQATTLYYNTRRRIKKHYAEYEKEVAEQNFNILHQILEDAVENNDRKNAIECVKEINKMTGITRQDNYIQNNTQIVGDTFEIKFK